uniref:C2 domain-containing protein n=1 Tax=Coptotermes formosanus TaxID=36987 RepID=L0AV54_COPFO|nr:C2 domain-containing protein [Coptotermes formosanus]
MQLSLNIRVIEAIDLPKMDSVGKTDAYVVVQLASSSQAYKTKVIDNSLSPCWNDDFQIILASGLTDTLKLTLFDKDVLKDDKFATLEIPLYAIVYDVTHDCWFDCVAEKKVPKGGKIHLLIHVSSGRFPPFQAPKPTLVPVTLHLKIIEASQLPKVDTIGKTDPYLKFIVSGDPNKYETKWIENTLEPKWNEEYHINLKSSASYINFELWDKDKKYDDFISSLDIQLSTFRLYKVHDLWFNMAPGKKVNIGGRLHLIIHLSNPGAAPFVNHK